MSERARGQLLLLMGPEGSGKTTLGRMLEQRLGAHFVHIDELAPNEATHELLVVECNGTSFESDCFATLRERYEVLYVRVHAEHATCSARIAERARTSHEQLAPEQTARSYERSSSLSLPWDLELDNDAGLDARSVADAVRPLLRS